MIDIPYVYCLDIVRLLSWSVQIILNSHIQLYPIIDLQFTDNYYILGIFKALVIQGGTMNRNYSLAGIKTPHTRWWWKWGKASQKRGSPGWDPGIETQWKLAQGSLDRGNRHIMAGDKGAIWHPWTMAVSLKYMEPHMHRLTTHRNIRGRSRKGWGGEEEGGKERSVRRSGLWPLKTTVTEAIPHGRFILGQVTRM